MRAGQDRSQTPFRCGRKAIYGAVKTLSVGITEQHGYISTPGPDFDRKIKVEEPGQPGKQASLQVAGRSQGDWGRRHVARTQRIFGSLTLSGLVRQVS